MGFRRKGKEGKGKGKNTLTQHRAATQGVCMGSTRLDATLAGPPISYVGGTRTES